MIAALLLTGLVSLTFAQADNDANALDLRLVKQYKTLVARQEMSHSAMKDSPYYKIFLEWFKYTKSVQGIRQKTESLQKEIIDLRNFHEKWDGFFDMGEKNVSTSCQTAPTVKMFFLLLKKIDDITMRFSQFEKHASEKEEEFKKLLNLERKHMKENSEYSTSIEKMTLELQKRNVDIEANITKLEGKLQALDTRCQKLDDVTKKIDKKLLKTTTNLMETDSKLYQKIDQSILKNDQFATEINNTISNAIEKTNDNRIKFSDLESKQKMLFHNITEGSRKLQQSDDNLKGKLKLISGEIKRIKDTSTSLQQQINENKCQSGIVRSSYNRKPNMVSDKSVRFARPFKNKPNVVFGLSVFDSSSKTNARLQSYLIKLDRYGFTLRISAFAGTMMYQAHYFWMACP